jgi:hypothetical protein
MDVTAIMVAKRDPHPASDDGNAMEYLVNKERKLTSKNMRSAVAMIVFCLLSDLVGAVAAAVAESFVVGGTVCLWLVLKATLRFEFF